MKALIRKYNDPKFPNAECYVEAFPPDDPWAEEGSITCENWMMRCVAAALLLPLGFAPPIGVAAISWTIAQTVDSMGSEDAYHEGVRRVQIAHTPIPVFGGKSTLDAAAFTPFIDPFKQSTCFWKGFQLAVRLFLVGGMEMMAVPEHQAAWATMICFVVFRRALLLLPHLSPIHHPPPSPSPPAPTHPPNPPARTPSHHTRMSTQQTTTPHRLSGFSVRRSASHCGASVLIRAPSTAASARSPDPTEATGWRCVSSARWSLRCLGCSTRGSSLLPLISR